MAYDDTAYGDRGAPVYSGSRAFGIGGAFDAAIGPRSCNRSQDSVEFGKGIDGFRARSLGRRVKPFTDADLLRVPILLAQPTAMDGNVGSILTVYRDALRFRHEHPGFAGEAFRWIDAPTSVLVFERGPGVRCVVNLAGEPLPLRQGRSTLLGSEPLEGDRLSAGAAIWDAAEGYDR